MRIEISTSRNGNGIAPNAMLVVDTETRTDRTQRLTFGCYRFIVGGQLVKENLFYGDDLPAKDRRILERYVADAPSSGT